MLRALRVLWPILVVLFSLACAEPPLKEMNQAQGAIDAARAAGAEQYATAELAAATDALQRAETAAAERDYRLALGLAIESRERAQAAAKAAVDTRTKARGDAERIVAETNALLTQARTKWDDAALGKLTRRLAADARATFAMADTNMQEARAALERDDYAGGIQVARSVSTRIRELLATLDKPAASPPTRPRR